MGETSPAAPKSASHSRDTSHDRPSLNVRQPNPRLHLSTGEPPKSVLKKKSADEHTALLASQREQYGEPLSRGEDEEGDYFGDEEDWQESRSTWYMILLTLAIGG